MKKPPDCSDGMCKNTPQEQGRLSPIPDFRPGYLPVQPEGRYFCSMAEVQAQAEMLELAIVPV